MNQFFTSIFNEIPHEKSNGGYFYHTNFRNLFDDDKTNMTFEEYKQWKTSCIRKNIQFEWMNRTLPSSNKYRNHWISQKIERQVQNAIRQIADEGKPFLNLASNFDLGLIPYILKCNPHIPCLAGDCDEVTIREVRTFIDEYFPEYCIEVASFDSYDIPIHDCSLDYVTSQGGITMSTIDMASKQEDMWRRAAIREVYRILKPSGRFITFERSFEYGFDDLMKLYDEHNKDGKLFGIYSREEIQAVCEKLSSTSWSKQFLEAGFQVEVEEKELRKSSLPMIQEHLLHFTNKYEIHCFAFDEFEKESGSLAKDKSLCSSCYTGLNLFTATNFFILRKPQ